MLKNKKGFTLIELIIVMAIIGILAVVAIVAISGKTADARNARRLADMSSVRTAFAISCADGDLDLTVPEVAAGTTSDMEVCSLGSTAYLNFTNVMDPSNDATYVDNTCDAQAATTEGCAIGETNVCEYSLGVDDTGAALPAATVSINPCSYYVKFFLEGNAALSSAQDEGLFE